jgi:hypothetical protein
VTCCKLGLPEQKAERSCALPSPGIAYRARAQNTVKASCISEGAINLCVGVRGANTVEVKPQAARIRTGRSYVASSGHSTLPKLQNTPGQQHRTLGVDSEQQRSLPEQPRHCEDLALFELKGSAPQLEGAGLERQKQAQQPRKGWGRFEAARSWAAQQSRPATEPHTEHFRTDL